MRAGLASSVTLHVLVLGWGLVSLSAPASFEVDDVEALPIELVTIQELTQIQEGAQDAPKDGPASLAPTEPPKPDPDAVNTGNQEKDQSTPETETQKAVEVEEARLPDPSQVPIPKPAPREEPKPVVEEKPEPVATPATEVAPKPAPKEEVVEDAVEELIAKAEPQPVPDEAPKSVQLPDQLPTPEARPEKPQAQTAKTPERKKEETQQAQSSTTKEKTEEKSDEVASLLNREKGSGGGSKANNQKASAGGKKTTSGNTLTQSEMDSLRGQIQSCWSIPASAQGEVGLKVSVQFQLNQSAQLEGKPRVTTSSGNRQLDDSAVRAVARCGSKGFQLPSDKYDSWRDVVVNFDPSEMFR
ncbi:cell envelope integrity protein TolA [Ahrensia kielensis]|uniref:Cell envelope integrity protein TolA n=1 Tax=Ahrensia kielensis TaxID=76980 RepID=A0ABU9T6H4_9HYPH